MLNIALIADSHHAVAEPFAGGLEAHVWSLSNALLERGHHVTLFAGLGSDASVASRLHVPVRPELSSAAKADRSMVAEEFLNTHHAYLEILLGLARDSSGSFDVIHNHSLHHLPIAMSPMIATPMLTTLHTPPTPWLESAIRTTHPNDVRFVAVSKHTAQAWQPTTGEIEVVYNGVDSSRWPQGPGGEDLIWFGRVTPEKGTHLAIRAARGCGRRLLLAGPIDDHAYFAQWVEPELGRDLMYLGHLRQAELARQVGRCAATLVTPTWDEPYGLVIAESMACGTPIVAFGVGGIPELINDCGGVVVEPGDVAAFSAAIPRAIELPRKAVTDHARRHLSIDAMVDDYERVYGELSG